MAIVFMIASVHNNNNSNIRCTTQQAAGSLVVLSNAAHLYITGND